MMPKPVLIFPYGESEGILNAKVASNQQASHAEQPFRELLQNSIDAADIAKRRASIHFIVEEIDIDKMPLYQEYKREFNKINEYWENQESEPTAKEAFKKISKALERPKIKILSVVDNGCGFSRGRLENLFRQNSYKEGRQSARGSYGQGHLTAYGLSDFRYVIYVGKSKDDNDNIQSIYSGSTILAGQEIEEQRKMVELGSRARILSEKPEDRRCIREYKYSSDDNLPDFLIKHYNKIKDTGSIVSIIGFNGNLDKDFRYIVASNFFIAILKEQVEVLATNNGETIKLDKSMTENILKDRQSRVNRSSGSILSGSEAYKAYKIIQNESQYLKEIELDKDNKVKCYISVDDQKPQFKAIFREGMVVASRSIKLNNKLESLPNVSKKRKFSVLITLEQADCSEFYRLIKGIEDPHHKELNINNVADEEDEKKIRSYCNKLYRKILGYVDEIETEDFPLPIINLPFVDKIFSNKKVREMPIKPPGSDITYNEPGPSPDPSSGPRPGPPSPKPRYGHLNFPGEVNYRIKDNNQMLIKVKLKEATDEKRLSVALREDAGYDNDMSNNSKALEIKSYRLLKNSQTLKKKQ